MLVGMDEGGKRTGCLVMLCLIPQAFRRDIHILIGTDQHRILL